MCLPRPMGDTQANFSKAMMSFGILLMTTPLHCVALVAFPGAGRVLHSVAVTPFVGWTRFQRRITPACE